MIYSLEQLRRNDPGVTYVHIPLAVDHNVTDAEWSEALQANEHVKKITFDFSRMVEHHWDLLLRVIAMRGNLEEVTLWNHSPNEVTNRFLQAIQQNSAIQTVSLSGLRLSGTSIASFLDSATTVTSLRFINCGMEASERERGSLELAAAIQRNTNIRHLTLTALHDVYLLPILSSLVSNSIVKELALGGHYLSLAATHTVRRLVESTTTIEGFELAHCISGVETFRQIAEGLINSESVTDIKLENCRFNVEGSAIIFKSILESKTNLRSLCLRGCQVYRRALSATTFTNLLRPDSPLRSLEFSGLTLDDLFTHDEFAALLVLVEKSNLERLCIGNIDPQHKCEALIRSIPKMQLKTLHFILRGRLVHLKSDLIGAVKRNTSLRTVVGELNGVSLFDEDGKRKLKSYAVRNEGLAQWIASPATVPRGAWAKTLTKAQVTGPDTAFCLLRYSVHLWVEDAASAVASIGHPERSRRG